MKKCGSKIALSLIAALAMVFAFATCSIDDMVADSSENGECGATHEWNEGEIIKAATENDDGEKKFTCTKCGSTKAEAIPALGHSHTVASGWTFDEAHHWHNVSCGNESHKDKAAHEWNEGEITKAATESDDGEKKFTCVICGSTKTEAIPALDHNHTVASEWMSDEEFHWHEASCEKEEHRTDKTAHEWNDGNVTTAPTCTAEGKRTYTCTTCGKTRTETVATNGHEWNDGEITKAATENDDGEKTFTCTTCAETRMEAIPALGHEHSVASEWTSDEEFHWHEASCGREAHRTDKTEHVWNTGEITTAPTCTAEGKRTYTCTVCGKTRTEPVATSEHYYGEAWKSDASGHWKECVNCGERKDFSEHADTTVSLTSDGERQETCPTCGYESTPSAWTDGAFSGFSQALEKYVETNANAKVKVAGEFSDESYIITWTIPVTLGNFSSRYGSSKQIDLDLSRITGLTKIRDNYFKSCTSLASVKLPNGITTIGKDAFSGCTSLTSVALPNGLTAIENYAFRECTSLTNVMLPDSLTTIGDYAFQGCTSLASVTLLDGLKTIGNYAFNKCQTLPSIKIPDSVTTIGYHAFKECTSLASITLSTNIKEISGGVFSGCKSLKSITIPSNVTKIGTAAFEECEQLEKVENIEGVTIINNFAFKLCKSLKTIRIPPSVTEISDQAFGMSGLETIEFCEGLKKIMSMAFYNCLDLSYIEIPSSVVLLKGSAFEGCTSLISVKFKDTSGWKYSVNTQELDLSDTLVNANRLSREMVGTFIHGELHKD